MGIIFENEHLEVDNAYCLTTKMDAAKQALRDWLLNRDPDYFKYNDNADRCLFTDNPFSLVDTVDQLTAQLDGLPPTDAMWRVRVLEHADQPERHPDRAPTFQPVLTTEFMGRDGALAALARWKDMQGMRVEWEGREIGVDMVVMELRNADHGRQSS